jgi:hypothetical protein
MQSPRIITVLLTTLLLSLPQLANAKKQELPEVTEEGLHRVHDSKLAIVYAEPGASLAGYERVKLLDAYVAFKKNWERDQRTSSAQPLRITSKDVENIKNRLAEEFHAVFRQVLEEGGYPVVDEAANNLDVKAPDTPQAGRTMTYVSSAGEMTLYLEAYDSVTGDLIAKALDRKADRRNDGFYTWSNSVTNRAAAQRILKGWATILLNALNEAKNHQPETGNPAENES